MDGLRLELHCHSTYSDGSFPATEVAQMAHKFDVRLFCLTDHDTYAGYEATKSVLEPSGCAVLRGLELSCRAYEKTVHMLVYGLQPGPGLEQLRRTLGRIHESRCERLREICERMTSLGFPLEADSILRGSHGRSPGRPDVARALTKAGYCSSPREAFTRWLNDEGPGYVPVERLEVEQGLALGQAAGAKMSLAHPHSLKHFALVRDLFKRYASAGLEGIEALYGRYGLAESREWLGLAAELGLVVTGGSDFHGEMTPDVTRPGLEFPDDRAKLLSDWLEVDVQRTARGG